MHDEAEDIADSYKRTANAALLNDRYFALAAEHFGYLPDAPIAKQDREVLALADFMRSKFEPLEREMKARLAMLIKTQDDAYGGRAVGFRDGQISELERVIKKITESL